MKLATLALTGALLAPGPVGALETASDGAAAISVTADNAALTRTISPRAYVQARASRSGWVGAQWRCIDALVARESSWRLHARNSHSSAYGLFQFLHMTPGTPLARQYRQFEAYIHARYGTPCAALHHSLTRGFY